LGDNGNGSYWLATVVIWPSCRKFLHEALPRECTIHPPDNPWLEADLLDLGIANTLGSVGANQLMLDYLKPICRSHSEQSKPANRARDPFSKVPYAALRTARTARPYQNVADTMVQ
jgi:hypothetical protein